MTSADIATWLEDAGWTVVVQGGYRVIAERRILGTPHDWQVLFLRQLPGMPWTARLTQRTPDGPNGHGGYRWGISHSSPNLHSLAEVGLWLGGVISSIPDHAA